MTGWSKVVNELKSMIEIGPSWQKVTADDASEIVLRFALFLLISLGHIYGLGSQILLFAGSAAFADYGATELLRDAIPSTHVATQGLRSRVSPNPHADLSFSDVGLTGRLVPSGCHAPEILLIGSQCLGRR
jgi:hypothetical protein